MHFARLQRNKLRCDPARFTIDLWSDRIPREQISVERNRIVPARRAFVLQGNGPIYLVHMPHFGASNLRQQCILNGELLGAGLKAYTEAKRANPGATLVACTLEREGLSTIIKRKFLRCMIYKLTAEGYVVVSLVVGGAADVIKDKPYLRGADYKDQRPQIPTTELLLSRPRLSIEYALLPLRYGTRNAYRSCAPSRSKRPTICKRSDRRTSRRR